MNKHGILLKVVQVLMDMNLVVTKAYISSDGVGSWMVSSSDFSVTLSLKSLTTYGLLCFPVFNVITCEGNKIRDQEVINAIQMVNLLSIYRILNPCTCTMG